MSGVNLDAFLLGPYEERILTSFTRRLIEIAAVTSARGPVTPATSLLNSMHLPAIALDRCGFVVDVNAAATVVFDDDVKVKDKRLFVRDLEARTLLKASLDSSASPVESHSLIAEPIIVQRRDKLPVILRIWPLKGPRTRRTRSAGSRNTECVGAKRGRPQRSSPRRCHFPFGGEARPRHSSRRASANCCPRTGNSLGDSSYSG